MQQQIQPLPTLPSRFEVTSDGSAGTTPELELPEDRTIGNGHRSTATSVSAKQLQPNSGNTGIKATYLDLVSGPFFVEAFSGSGRQAVAVRAR